MARTKVFNEEEVLDRAMNLFWQKGYHATSAQDLVDHLGISRSSLYDTFGDKHSLFVQALRRYQRIWIDDYMDRLAQAGDVEGCVKMLFEMTRDQALQSDKGKGCFMINTAVELAASDQEIADIINAIKESVERKLISIIKKGQHQGYFTRKFSAGALSTYILNALNGLRVTMKFDVTETDLNNIIKVCLATLKL